MKERFFHTHHLRKKLFKLLKYIVYNNYDYLNIYWPNIKFTENSKILKAV